MITKSHIHLHKDIAVLRPESSIADKYGESTQFAHFFRRIADAHGAAFLDAAEFAQPSVKDCVHMEADSHKALANSAKEKVLQIFQEHPNPCKCSH